MKRLYLLRHAKSSWDDPTLADHDRPLAPRGRRAAKVIAKHLGRKGISPELVLCSPSRRTRQTLKRLAPGLGKNVDVRIEPELYAASAPVLLEVLHEVPDEIESVVLIGHNPGIQDLALSLAGDLTVKEQVSDRGAGNAGAERNLARAGARKRGAGVVGDA